MEKVGSVFFFVGGITNPYQQVKFDYQGNTVEETFSVNVVRKHKPNSQAFVFLPHSLWEAEKDKYAQKGSFGFLFLPSMGTTGGKLYQATYEYLILWIFLNMLKFYMENKDTLEEIYVDISLGLNIYVETLKEGFRTLALFDRLMNLSDENTRNKKFYILFSDPVFPPQEAHITRKISEKEIQTQAWFDSPIKGFRREIYDRLGIDRKYVNMLEEFYHTYKAVKFNAPLAVYTFGYHQHEEILSAIKELTDYFLKAYSPEDYEERENKIIYRRMPDEETIKTVQNMLLSLALYYNLSKTLEQEGVLKTDEVEAEALRNSFNRIYKRYGLFVNCMLLNADINRWMNKKETIAEEKRFLYQYNTSKRKRNTKSLSSRNFFAHSGFEDNSTLVRKQGDKLLFMYNRDVRDKIRNLIADENMEVCGL